MDSVIGIDLGTTNSCVAAVVDGNPRVFPNKGGYKTTPSMFAVARDGQRLVGHIAKRQAIINPDGTVHSFKRLMGRSWGTEEQLRAMEVMGCKLVQGRHGDVRVDLAGEVISMPEVAAEILAEMKEVAERSLERPVKRAVITVPAHFSHGQRYATKEAGVIAGLDVIRIVNEPTAAALAYGFGKRIDKTVVVFDLGGGTFDVSLVRITEGVFEVLATTGDTHLGGNDFDERVVEWLIYKFANEHRVDLRGDSMAMQRLRDAAESAKCELSTARVAEINLPFIHSNSKGSAAHLQATLAREKLDDLCEDLVERTIDTCRKLLTDSGISREEIDDVILVGGQTRMPVIQARVVDTFGRQPCKGVHPDEAVALGAAIQAGLLSQSEEIRSRTGQEMLLLDVTPMSLGIMIVKGYFMVLIPANTTVPTSASHVFTTVRDDQTEVRIMVLQGESKRALDNELLGEFVLSGLPQAPRGQVRVEVAFEIEADGTVAVSARNLETAKEQTITVVASVSSNSAGAAPRGLVPNAASDLGDLPAPSSFEELRSFTEGLMKTLDDLLPELGRLEHAEATVDLVGSARRASGSARQAIKDRDEASLERIAQELECCLSGYRRLLASDR